MKLVFSFLFCTILLSGCSSFKKEKESINNAYIHQIDSLVQQQHLADKFHGGVVITKDGELIYEKYIGIANRSWNIPVNKEVKFDIASINKSMIAALIVRAIEKELLRLKTPLIELLKNYEYEGNFDSSITLHHLMSHTSGLGDYGDIPKEMQKNNFLFFKRKRFTNEEYINFISKLDPVSEVGASFNYSNFAYHLLAIIIEDTYKLPFEKALRQELAEPLGLNNTVSSSNNNQLIKNLAEAYQFDTESKKWKITPFIDLSLGRRIFSTVFDLSQWANSMSNPGYLSESSLSLIKQNHLKGISNNVSYGYGWVSIDSNNQSDMGDLDINLPYIIHGGSTDGYKSMLINIDDGAFVVSFLSNVGNQTNELQLAKELVKLIPLEP